MAEWNDNESVAVLGELSRAIDRVAGLVPERGVAESAQPVSDPLPLQHLGAHLMFARHWEVHRERLLRQAVTRPCPLCGGGDRWTWFDTQDGYRYDVCHACGMIHIPAVVPIAAWDDYYQSLPEARASLQQQLEESASDEAARRNDDRFGRYIALLRRHGAANSGERLLDLGSFTGAALRVAAGHGLSAFGVEGLAEAVRFAHERFGPQPMVHARTEEFDTNVFGGGFDVLTMWETLEHTSDPMGSLRRAAQALRPGGMLAVSVPNARNPQFSLLGQFCFFAYGGYHYTGHINMFGPDTLRRALQTAGFEPIHMQTEFGTDWRQLLFYVRQKFDRIHCYRNLVRFGNANGGTADLPEVLNWLSPALTRLENACLAGPILLALARRTG